LTLRVLVDRSVVEAFAMGGRAALSVRDFGGGEATALEWSAAAAEEEGGARHPAAAAPPTFSVRVWSMRTGYRDPSLAINL
jgi:hypothetical protein